MKISLKRGFGVLGFWGFGETYEGDWANDKREGFGIWIDPEK